MFSTAFFDALQEFQRKTTSYAKSAGFTRSISLSRLNALLALDSSLRMVRCNIEMRISLVDKTIPNFSQVLENTTEKLNGLRNLQGKDETQAIDIIKNLTETIKQISKKFMEFNLSCKGK